MTTQTVQTSSTATTKAKTITASVPFKITGVDQSKKYLKMLVYGRPGTGKSTLAASAVDVPSMRDVFYISAEAGTMVINDNPRVHNAQLIDIVEVTSWSVFVKIYEFISSHIYLRDQGNIDKIREYESMLKGIPKEEIEHPRLYNTVIIDSLSEIDRYCLAQLLGADDGFDKSLLDPNQKTAEFAEYKKLNNMINTVIRGFRDLKCNLILICATDYEKDELQRFNWMPKLTGKLSSQVIGHFDVVGFLQAGQATESNPLAPRRLYVQPVGKFEAKNRRADFKEAWFDDPTMTSIFKGFNLAS